MSYRKEYEKWLLNDSLDLELKEELLKIKDNETEIKERFAKSLEFGTAGLRGIIGAGTNRMNRYVVGAATQGLSEVIKEVGEDAKKRGVVIAFDSRKNSDLFAKEAALVLAGNGIKAYLFESLRPVPELSFAVRHLKAIAGIVITASHNPYQYNGYKAYWEDGSQLPPEFASKVFDIIQSVDIFSGVKRADEQTSLIQIVGKEIDDLFINEVLKLSISPNAVKEIGENFKIVYTPFHGSGNIPVREVLKRAGHQNVLVVKEQELPDPLFSTVKSPNPEDKEGFFIAIDYAKRENADLIIGTDPDCDRVGIAVPTEDGEYTTLTGNQVGVLLTHYILNGLKEQGKLPQNGCVIKSIVTTKMTKAVCDDFGIELIDVLTGFKFIGEKIKEFETTKAHTFLFGFEESYGYLSGTHARDKDGVNAAMLIAEMAAYYKLKNSSVYDALDKIYQKYGYYKEKVISLTFEGLDGMEKISKLMKELRKHPKQEIGNQKVIKIVDYQQGVEELPQADVLRFELEDDTTLFVRPSGTEPKIKGYIMAKDDSALKAELKTLKYEQELKELLK